MVDLLESHYYERSDIKILNEDIELIIYNWSIIMDKVKPKLHITQHFQDLIEEFSVLKAASTLRLERLNRFNKMQTQNSQNYYSLPKQIIEKWTINFILNSFNFKKDELVKSVFKPAEFEIYFKHEFENVLPFVDQSSDLEMLKYCQFDNGQIIEENSFYLLDYIGEDSQLPEFIKVSFIFRQNSVLKFICKKIKTIQFCKSVYAFKAKQNPEYQEFNEEFLSKIKFQKKLAVISFHDFDIINKSFYIPYRFSKIYDN